MKIDRYKHSKLRVFGKPPHGFTLVELLVVISIIALLLAIMMPSLRAARERARRIVCKNNLHQMGLASLMYNQNFDGYFPILKELNSAAVRWAGNLLYDWPGTADDRPNRPLNPYLGIGLGSVVYDSSGLWSPDISSPARCPADRYKYFNAWPGMTTMYFAYGTSYMFNALGTSMTDLNGLTSRKYSQIRQPGLMVLCADIALDFPLSYGRNGTPDERQLGPHVPGQAIGNAAFVDGHADWIDFTPIDAVREYWRGSDWNIVVTPPPGY